MNELDNGKRKMLTPFTIPVVMTMGNFIVEPHRYVFGLTVLFVVGVRYIAIEGILKGSPVVCRNGVNRNGIG